MRCWFPLLILLTCLGCSNRSDIILKYESLAEGDILIFYDDNIYLPQMVREIDTLTISLISSNFQFKNACPEKEQINDTDFSEDYYLTYDRNEIINKINNGTIAEIY